MMMRPDEVVADAGAGGGAGGVQTPAQTQPGSDVAPGQDTDGIFAIPLEDEIDAIVETAAVETAQTPSGAAAAPAPVAVSPTPVPVAQPAVAQPVAQPAQPAAQPQQQAQPAAQPAGQIPSYTVEELQAMTPEKFRDALAENRDTLINFYADNLFALSAEESEQLQVNPEKVLPRLMAKLFFETSAMIPHQLQQFGPRMVQTHLNTTRQHQDNESAFFAYWPGMPRGESAKIVGALNAFKNANPQATKDQVIAFGGALACQMLGLDPNVVRSAKPSSAAAPASNGNGAQTMQPFRPAGSQVAQIPPAIASNGQGADNDPWSGFLTGD